MSSTAEDANRVEAFLASNYGGREAEGLRKLAEAAKANAEHGMQFSLALVAMRLKDKGTIRKKEHDEILEVLDSTPA